MNIARDNAPLPPDKNLGPAVLATIWVEVVVCMLVLVMRFYTRARRVGKVAWDDWVMLFAFALAVVDTILTTVAVHYGTGRHETHLDPGSQITTFKWNMLGQVVGILSSTFSRISFCIMLFAIISSQQRISKMVLWLIVISQLLLNISLSIYILLQCRPTQKLWNHALPGTCLSPNIQEHFGFVQGSINSATDLMLAIFPATIIWNLNMKLAVKLTLCLTMGLGVFAMAASVAKTIYLKSISEVNDFSYETAYLLIWFSLEQYIIIIAASIPTLRPLIGRTQSRKSSYNQSKDRPFGKFTHPIRSGGWKRQPTVSETEMDRIQLTNRPNAVHYEYNFANRADFNVDDARGNQHTEHRIAKTVEVEIRRQMLSDIAVMRGP